MEQRYKHAGHILDRLENEAIDAAIHARKTHRSTDCSTAAHACGRVVWLAGLLGDERRVRQFGSSSYGWKRRAEQARLLEVERRVRDATAVTA